jgi:predicted nucleotidyltransferase component of viral defense system
MMDKTCIETVRLLLEIAPAIFETPHFAMKGGTAINLFVENMPRLSVDIDVVYKNHHASRDEALESIARELDAARERLIRMGIEAELSGPNAG